MTMNRAVTRIKRPPPRNPVPAKPEGIYGAADVGIARGYSADFWQALEDMLHQRWSVMAKAEKNRSKMPNGQPVKFVGDTMIRAGTVVERVYEVIQGKKSFTSRDVSEWSGFPQKQVSNALSNLKKSGIVSEEGKEPGKNGMKIMSHIGGAIRKGPGPVPQQPGNAHLVRRFLKASGPSSRKEIESALDMTERQVSYALKSMRRRGYLFCEYDAGVSKYMWHVSKGESE